MGLKTWKKWTDWPLMALSVVFLVVYTWEILQRSHIVLCERIINAIWIVFVADYVVSLLLAERKWPWFKENLFTLLTIALPMFRPLRLLRLLTVLHVLNRTSGMAVRGRITVYAFGAVSMLMYVGALAVYAVERDAEGASITDFLTALWWAFVTVTTVGYGDVSPVTTQGKLIAVALMFSGIALIGIVTATLSSWIVDQVNQEADRREIQREERRRADDEAAARATAAQIRQIQDAAVEAIRQARAESDAAVERAQAEHDERLRALQDEVHELTAALAAMQGVALPASSMPSSAASDGAGAVSSRQEPERRSSMGEGGFVQSRAGRSRRTSQVPW